MENNSEIPIEKGVPIPPGGGRGRPRRYPFDALEVGDSFVVDAHISSVRNLASRYGRENEKSFRTRTQKDGTVRVWRTQ